jgi:hypothetical protein
MTSLIKKHKVISLGCSCFCSKYIYTHIRGDQYSIFDYIGTSMWSILELLKNNFDGLMQKENIKKIPIKHSCSDIHTNVKYYVRFFHERMDEKNIDLTIKANERRAQRFKTMLERKDTVIFLRIEESQENRIKYDEYAEYTKKSEHDYVLETSQWLKNNTKLKFIIIHFGTAPTKYDKDNNVIFINVDINDFTWNNCHGRINDTLNNHFELIQNATKDLLN